MYPCAIIEIEEGPGAMSFVALQFTKGEINRAGAVLCRSPQRYDMAWLKATRVLANWRGAHAYPINTFQATLRSRLKNIDAEALVAQRLKRTPSIIAKLQRFSGMQLARMQDIGGLRAVVNNISHLRSLQDLYKSAYLSHELLTIKDYTLAPKEDGYRSVHLIYRYNSFRTPDYDGLLIELQMRTKMQHAWATAVETMGTYLGQALKSGQGDEEWRTFFKTASAALAHLERSPPVPGYGDLERNGVYDLLVEQERELNVLGKLRGFAIVTERIYADRGKGTYHLIVLNSEDRSVKLIPFPLARLEAANAEYAQIEERAKNGEPLEAVLVSAGPIEDLKKAYPNYFLDTQVFIDQIQRIISAAQRRNRK